MAPEMLMGKEYDEKVDVFSLGMILYTLAILHHPIDKFENMNQSQIKKSLIEKYSSNDLQDIFNFRRDELLWYNKKLTFLLKRMLDTNTS